MAVPYHAFVIALVGCSLGLWLGIPLASRIGLVDRPGGRKQHRSVTPLVGGAAMFVGAVPGLLSISEPMPHLTRFLLVVTIIMIVGVWDDLVGLRVRYRFLTEFAVALAITLYGGVAVRTLGDLLGFGVVNLHEWASLFTMLCVVGVVNAFNMTDGLDGLAAGLSLVSFVLLTGLAWGAGRMGEAFGLGVLVAVLLPFFGVNSRLFGRSQAATFMGDAGSKFLGFTLAWFTIALSQGENPAFAPVTALWLIALPLIDMFSSIVRRLAWKRPPFGPDLDHLHHLLWRRGWGVNAIVLGMMAISLAFGLVGIILPLLGVPDFLMFFGILGIFGLYCRWGLRRWGGRTGLPAGGVSG
ncbi:MAG: undecaprenyl/decaprenyl-phosphate alpha-N-acetylglucosaminyl 1-phosphate transferase [Magnetococcales bacterium]|nr:undecaprenyl/decaprenyl-phosphate alpha-N-acetylglucosaminyl 1-phosphate transferase [Magnetococcales bacterium]